MKANDVIQLLGLEPLPQEGGFFKRTYAATHTTPVELGTRPISTAIYFLLTPTDFSSLHRLKHDELFHFYLGDPVEMIQLTADGAQITLLGHDIQNGQCLQQLVPKGVWQGCRLVPGGEWALLGTTVAPGFDFADFELATRGDLVNAFPRYTEIIMSLTRS